jgi:hypothetical protein
MDNTTENWKYVIGYEGLYEVSTSGIVRSIDRVIYRNGRCAFYKGRVLKTYINRGYVYVTLSKKGIESGKKVHRLVAEAFIPNPDKFPDVNHKDENKSNNCIENLEWCTKEYNRKYGTASFRSRLKHRAKGRAIKRYDLDGNLIKIYDCTSDLNLDGFDRRAVYLCCKGKKNTYKGSVWCFANSPLIIRENKLFKKVYKYDLNGNYIKSYRSIVEAEKSNGINNKSIRYLNLGDRKNPVINGFRYSFTKIQ